MSHPAGLKETWLKILRLCPREQGSAEILESRGLCELSCISCPSSSLLTEVIQPEGLREAGLEVEGILGLGHWWEGLIGKKARRVVLSVW